MGTLYTLGFVTFNVQPPPSPARPADPPSLWQRCQRQQPCQQQSEGHAAGRGDRPCGPRRARGTPETVGGGWG